MTEEDLPPKARPRLRPARGAALDDAFAAYAVVMRRLRLRVEAAEERGHEPSANDVRDLVRTTDTLTKLVRTDIIHDQHANPEDLDDAALLLGVEEAARVLGEG